MAPLDDTCFTRSSNYIPGIRPTRLVSWSHADRSRRRRPPRAELLPLHHRRWGEPARVGLRALVRGGGGPGVGPGAGPGGCGWVTSSTTPRPTYRSFRVAQRALAKVREHGVDAVMISGNHDTPRLPGTGSPYSALADSFPGFHFAHRLAYERFELPGLVVHAVPQMLTVEAALEAIGRGRPPAQRGPHEPAVDPSPPHPAAAPARRHQRDRGRRWPAAIRSRAPRPLPLLRPGIGDHVVRRVDRHLQLRRRPRPGQGDRGARHRHGGVPAPPGGGADASW